jgi:hypothetical protein
MNKITLKLISGETINYKDLVPYLDIVKRELKFIKENCNIVLKQIKKVQIKRWKNENRF